MFVGLSTGLWPRGRSSAGGYELLQGLSSCRDGLFIARSGCWVNKHEADVKNDLRKRE